MAPHTSSMFLCVLLVAPSWLLADGASMKQNETARYDIAQFLNTSQLIWTINTTAHERQICKVDLMKNINQTYIAFYRSYYEPGRWRMKRYFGKFSKFNVNNEPSSERYDAMDVSKGRRHIVTEVLHYQSPDNSCAVFWVLGTHGYSLRPWYEMRMKDYKIKSGFSYEDECWKVLNETARSKIRRVYDPRCQAVLDTKYPSPANFKDK